MNIRRYYGKHNRNRHQWFPEIHNLDDYLTQMATLGYDNDGAMNVDTADYEIIISDDEANSWYFDCLQRVIDNPRWYLDNLETLPTFRVDIMKIFPNVISGPGRTLKKHRFPPKTI